MKMLTEDYNDRYDREETIVPIHKISINAPTSNAS